MLFSNECLPCLEAQLTRALDLTDLPAKKKRELVSQELEWVLKQEYDLTPAEMTTMVHHHLLGIFKRNIYAGEKERYSYAAAAMVPEIENLIAGSDDRLFTSILLSITGNALDLALTKDFDLRNEYRAIKEEGLSVSDYKEFKQELKAAEKIVFLADNAGEIYFDKYLILETGRQTDILLNKDEIINEATVKDGMEAGLDKAGRIISDGSRAIGVIPGMTSRRALGLIESAGLIISKGQANYEVFEGTPYPVFFLLKVKCGRVAEKLGVRENSYILKKNR